MWPENETTNTFAHGMLSQWRQYYLYIKILHKNIICKFSDKTIFSGLLKVVQKIQFVKLSIKDLMLFALIHNSIVGNKYIIKDNEIYIYLTFCSS